jgi:hypothetical protein
MEEVMNFVSGLTTAADLGVYVGALAVIVAAAFGVAELVGLVDRFLVERSIRRAFIRNRRTPMSKVVSIRQTRKLSEPGYLAMVCAIADILSPEGADQ